MQILITYAVSTTEKIFPIIYNSRPFFFENFNSYSRNLAFTRILYFFFYKIHTASKVKIVSRCIVYFISHANTHSKIHACLKLNRQ